jgi:hypothetical protein
MATETNRDLLSHEMNDTVALAPKAPWVTPTVTNLDVSMSEVAAATQADADTLS